MLNSQWYIPVPERKKLRLNKEERKLIRSSQTRKRTMDQQPHPQARTLREPTYKARKANQALWAIT
jgi:hypothetical protein